MKTILHLIYPPRCVACGEGVETDFALCPSCWGQMPFILGAVCDLCGAPLPGLCGEPLICDDCLYKPRPWDRGRSAVLYEGRARDLVLALKHGDRTDLARPMAHWLARVAAPLVQPGMVVVPVPLHRLRLLRRRYNQAALLGEGVARALGLAYCPDLLVRRRATAVQEGLGVAARAANIAGAIEVHPRRSVDGRPVLLVDDVMTSGATLAACAVACRGAGSGPVSVLALARVAKLP
ncbi:ComF family protein [Rhodovulum imhoffii]|uniref:ComF family protein n=1 Tax=Rhodovulum imhoffii TaxID=365340 RepID=A0A2T5BPA1_9RHOB|nr:ComF family protein [Rhodovulum imhoffii]MBK5933990.1 amidophosphoribosyltransferase [Rhodovulum imhoffii]PTN00823.1 ComF family protein [Rhodovulum imhoffii]